MTVLLVVAMYLVGITECGPWDPWETHYGEVARNILQRQDPMDLWWRPGFGPDGKKEQMFASKHALPFWMMALSMSAFGVGVSRDVSEMVQPVVPELALRLPALLTGLATIFFLAWVVKRLAGWRAGLLTAIVLATLPQFAIVARQAITDIFFIGPVCLAMGAWALAWLQPDRPLRTKGSGWKEVPWDRAFVTFALLFLVAGAVPVLVLQLHCVNPETIERVSRWSKRPTIPNVEDLANVARQLWIYWALVVVVFLRAVRWRRRSQPLMGVVYVAGGLSLMGKGMIGPGIIGLLILCDMVVNGRLKRLPKSELAVGILIFVVTCFPWHHAMALFRGERWVNELLIENNLARFATGEQKQAVGGFAFYLRTLGLAALPWVAALPAVLWSAVRAFQRPTDPEDTRTELHRLALLWFVVSFGLITYSVTKYYHYLAPCLPPLALLTGLWLDGLLRDDDRPSVEARFVAFAVAVGVLFLVVKATIAEPAWIAHLTTYLYTGMWREGAPETDMLAWLVVPFAVGLLAWVAARARIGVEAMVLSAVLTTGWLFGTYLPEASEHWSQRSAMRKFFSERGKSDPILSWWFYYRGETYFTKSRTWISTEPRDKKLHAYIDKHRGHGRTLWIMTTVAHAKRAKVHMPVDLREGLEQVYENAHYALLKLPVP